MCSTRVNFILPPKKKIKNFKHSHRSGCSWTVTRFLGVSLLFTSPFNNVSMLFFVLKCKPLCGGQWKIYSETLTLSKHRWVWTTPDRGEGETSDCPISLQHTCLSLTRPTTVVTDVIKTSWGDRWVLKHVFKLFVLQRFSLAGWRRFWGWWAEGSP